MGDGKSKRCLTLVELELDTCWDWHPCSSLCVFLGHLLYDEGIEANASSEGAECFSTPLHTLRANVFALHCSLSAALRLVLDIPSEDRAETGNMSKVRHSLCPLSSSSISTTAAQVRYTETCILHQTSHSHSAHYRKV